MDLLLNDFDEIVKNLLQGLKCSRNETKSYIDGIFKQFVKAEKTPEKKIIILEFSRAKEEYSFERFQNLADWLFFAITLYPKHLNSCPQNYYSSIARISYYRCYKILDGKWPLFEEMADRFNYFVEQIRPFSEPFIGPFIGP